MKNLLIIGARGWGREVYCCFFNYPMPGQELNMKGFLDSDTHALDGLRGEFPPIISSVEDYVIEPDDVFFCALGEPQWRKHYVEIIEQKGGKFVSYISPNSLVNPNASIGLGSFISPYTFISDNVNIGKHTIVHPMTTVGHDVSIGEYVTIESSCFVGGYASVGDMSLIHVHSTIIRHKKVGSHASVGAASVVLRNVKDNTSVYGNPAKRIE